MHERDEKHLYLLPPMLIAVSLSVAVWSKAWFGAAYIGCVFLMVLTDEIIRKVGR